jgi:hypothetical protein
MEENSEAPVVSDGGDRLPPAQGQPQTQPTEPVRNDFAVPDGYAEKGWAKNVKSYDDLWKMLDSSQELIGKKSVIPDLSDDKAREEYFSQLRPEAPDEYSLPEHYGEEVNKFYQEAFYEAGLSKEQADNLVRKHQEIETHTISAEYSKESLQDMLKQSFGDKYEEQTAKVFNHVRTMMTPEQQKQLEQLPNSALNLMAQYANKMMQEYGANEGTGNSGNQQMGGNAQANTADRQRLFQELQDLSKRPHSADEKQAMLNQYLATFR